MKTDLSKVSGNENKYYKIIKFYKDRLVELGVMRNLYNSCTSGGRYTKVEKKNREKEKEICYK